MTNARERFALIGAGPMGLATAKLLSRHGVGFQGFELNSGVGGLWDIEGPRSTMYETAHLISSRKMTEFTDFPMREDVAEYPSHREMKRYFEDFAEAFDALFADRLTARDFAALADRDGLGPLLPSAHPTVDHYLPALTIAGASDAGDELTYMTDAIDLGSVSMRSFIFHPA